MVQMFSTFEPMARVGFWRPLLRHRDEIFDVMNTALEAKDSASVRPLRFDLREVDNMYIINFDVPGIPKEDLNIELLGNLLEIVGQRTFEDRLEKRVSIFRQGIQLPDGIQTEHIAADLKDGVLRLTIQKPASVQATKIRIGESTPKSFLKNLLGHDKKSKDSFEVKHANTETVEVT